MLSNSNDLCAFPSDMSGLLGSRLTLYHELVRFGGPIIIVNPRKVDLFAGLFRLWPR